MMTFRMQSTEFPNEICRLSQGTGTQDLVPWTRQHDVGTRCANGARLVNFASANRLVVSSISFQHPQRHFVKWFSNDRRTRNQIDHILVRFHWASSVIDCRACNGAQTGSKHGSGHAMVRTRLRLRVKVPRISNRPAKLDMVKLKTVALEH